MFLVHCTDVCHMKENHDHSKCKVYLISVNLLQIAMKKSNF